jgi:adenylate cyclase
VEADKVSRLSIRLLGPLQVTLDSQPVTHFETEKARVLLAYLAVEADRPHPRELLAEMLWPGRPAGAASADLRHALASLRRAIADTSAALGAGRQPPPPFLLVNRQTIQFNSASDAWVDVQAFSALLRSPELPGQPALASLEEALRLVRGAFLEDISATGSPALEEWLLLTREQLARLALEARRRLAECYEGSGDYDQALRHAWRGLEIEGWDERAQRQVMRLLAFTGQRNAALAQYEVCRRALAGELGVEPEPGTTELMRCIRDDKLPMPPPVQERHPIAAPPAFLEEGAAEVEPPVFVARRQELARLQSTLDRALAGQGCVAFVTGGPGLGKTALLSEFARCAMGAHPDLLVARGNCSAISGAGDPYLPFRDVMAMLTGDVETRWQAGAISRDHARRLWGALPVVMPALLANGSSLIGPILPRDALLARAARAQAGGVDWLEPLRALAQQVSWAGSAEQQQSFLFQQYTGVLQALACRHPLVLLLDDLQWADSASIGLLFHLGRLGVAGSRILILCAYRPEEVALGRAGERHPLEVVLNELKRTFGNVWVDLDAAAQREGRGFVDAFLDTERNRLGKEFRTALFNRTEGHPLFTVELLRAMEERGDLLRDVRADGAWIEGPALDWRELPARVEAVIQERVDRLDAELREIINVACVEGEHFTAEVVAAVQGVADRPQLRALHKLEKLYGLVREAGEVQSGARGTTRYRFSHILVQEYLYRQLGARERRLLHGQVGTALESIVEGQRGEIAVQLAHHFYEADDPDRAFRYALLAAENAARAYANEEAIAFFTRAIELAQRICLNSTELASLHRGRALAHEILGHFEHARADHEAALLLGRTTGERRVEWRALLDLAELWTSRDYSRSRGYLDLALEAAQGMGDPAALAGSLNWVGNWYANAEHPAAAIGYHQEALRLFEQSGDRRDLAHTLDQLGIASILSGDLTAGVRYYDQAIPLFRELKDSAGLADSLTGRGIAGSSACMAPTTVSPTVPVDARRDLEEALQVAREIASPSAEAWALWALSVLHTGQGQFGPALETVLGAVRVASAAGHGEWIAGSRSILGALYAELLAPEAAHPQLEQALALAQQLRSQHWIHHATAALAATWSLLGQPARALACLAAVLSPEAGMDTMQLRTCWARRAELALAQGDPALALEIADRLIASAPGMSPGCVVTLLWRLKGEALTVIGHPEEARSLLQAAAENAQAPQERFHRWRVHASLARLYCTMDRQPDAGREFAVASELIEALAQAVPGQAFRDNFVQRARSTLGPTPLTWAGPEITPIGCVSSSAAQ